MAKRDSPLWNKCKTLDLIDLDSIYIRSRHTLRIELKVFQTDVGINDEEAGNKGDDPFHGDGFSDQIPDILPLWAL